MSDGKRGMRRGGRGKERGRVTGGSGGGDFSSQPKLGGSETWSKRT